MSCLGSDFSVECCFVTATQIFRVNALDGNRSVCAGNGSLPTDPMPHVFSRTLLGPCTLRVLYSKNPDTGVLGFLF